MKGYLPRNNRVVFDDRRTPYFRLVGYPAIAVMGKVPFVFNPAAEVSGLHAAEVPQCADPMEGMPAKRQSIPSKLVLQLLQFIGCSPFRVVFEKLTVYRPAGFAALLILLSAV